MATPESKGFHKKKKGDVDVKKIAREVISELAFVPFQKSIVKKIGELDAKKLGEARRAEKIGKQDVQSFQEAVKKKAGGRL
jgi:hypothetical protein